MEPDNGALPLSRGQLDIWLSQESGLAGTDWQLGLLGRIDGPIQLDALQRAVRQALLEAEPARAAFFEVNGEVFQKAIDYSDIEVAFHDLVGSERPADKVREIASAIQHTPMPLSGQLLKFALFRTGPAEHWFYGLCHHISLDG
jgi:glycopeptidolipid biosynthesis protein